MTSTPRPVLPVAAKGVLRQGLRIIGRGLRGQPRLFAVAVIGSAGYGVLTVAVAQVIGHLTGTVVQPAVEARHLTGGQLWTILWQLGLVYVALVSFTMVRRIAGGAAVFGLQAQYRRKVAAQYLRLPLSWHHRHPSGQLLSNANADVEAAWNVFMPLPMAFGVAVMLLVAGVAMVRVDLPLATVAFLVFPALLLANLVFQAVMSPRITRAQQLRAEVSEVAHESIEAGQLVKAMGREEAETERFGARSLELRDAAIRAGRTRGAFDPVIEAIPQLGTLAVLLVGTARVRAGAVTAAEVVQVAFLFSLLAVPVRAFGWVLGEVPRSVVGWRRVQAVLEAQGTMRTGEAEPARPVRGAERMDDVHYAYAGGASLQLGQEDRERSVEQVPALRGVDLDLPAGRTTAVVGPTGAGKSTLAGLTVRLMDPDEGVVRLDGVDLRDLRAGSLPQVVGLVAQTPFLFDDTVEGNVRLDRELSDEQVAQALAVAQADGFVGRLPHGMQTEVGERGASLSGGQRQRIALARAIAGDPALLVLDDATSAVDPSVEGAILDGLRQRNEGLSVLVVAYRSSTIALADHVVYLEDGRVLDQGSHDELMERCVGYRDVVTAYARQAAERDAAGVGAGPA